MKHYEYGIVQHPVSGESYGAQWSVLTGDGAHDEIDRMLVRVAGPLHYSDPTDEDSLAALIAHQPDEDARADAEWLQREIERHQRSEAVESRNLDR